MKLVLLVVFVGAFAESEAADGDDICTACTCSLRNNAQTIDIDCTNRTLHNLGKVWPVHKVVKANFEGNQIVTLEPLPSVDDAVLDIVLSNCSIAYLTSGLFEHAKNVRFLDLSRNRLEAEQLSSDKFKGPYNATAYEPIALKHLDLSYNQIHSLGKNLFEHMPNLKILNLADNDFKVLDVLTQLALSSIRSLQSLNLAGNELTELVVDAIDAHDNLTQLDLSNNSLDFVPFSLSHIGKSLEVLKLDGNPIFEFTGDTFLGLQNVTELSVNNLKLKYINANTFASMPKLKKLSLSNNYVLRDIDREAFGVNQTLKEFYLNNNNLYKIDYKLLPWSELEIFEFDQNPLTCSCDLYNITTAFSKEITRKEDSPFCEDPRTGRYVKVFYLKSDICLYKSKAVHQMEYIQYHFSVMRVAVIFLVVLLTTGVIVAAALALVKYRRHRREQNYPYASQIAYNPVLTNS